MANLKISQLSAATSLLSTDQFEINQSGASKSITAIKMAALSVAGTIGFIPVFATANSITDSVISQDVIAATTATAIYIGSKTPTSQGHLVLSSSIVLTQTGFHTLELNDSITVTPGGASAYAVIDTQTEVIGAETIDHYISIQIRDAYSSTGNILTEFAGIVVNNRMNGPATSPVYRAIDIRELQGSSTVTNNIQLLIRTPTKGTAHNYAIYSQGGDVYFGSGVGTSKVSIYNDPDTIPIVGNLDIGTGTDKTTSKSDVINFAKTNEVSTYSALQFNFRGGANQPLRYFEFQTIENGVANTGNIVLQKSGGKVIIGASVNVSNELLTLGEAGNAGGLYIAGSGSGGALLVAPGTAGSPTLTFPTSTGTFALTSDLSSYLPLAGATYTTTTGNGLALTTSTLTTGNLVSLTSTGTAAGGNSQTVLNISTSGANAASSQATAGLVVSNTHTGASAVNISGSFTATGGGAVNYGIYSSASGASANYSFYGAAGKIYSAGDILIGGSSSGTVTISAGVTGSILSVDKGFNVDLALTVSGLSTFYGNAKTESSTNSNVTVHTTTATSAAYLDIYNPTNEIYVGVLDSTGSSLIASGGIAYYGLINVVGNYGFQIGTNNISRFKIDNAGAATFANTLLAVGNFTAQSALILTGVQSITSTSSVQIADDISTVEITGAGLVVGLTTPGNPIDGQILIISTDGLSSGTISLTAHSGSVLFGGWSITGFGQIYRYRLADTSWRPIGYTG